MTRPLALLLALAGPAAGHDWYPLECCRATDCELAVGVKRNDAWRAWVMPNVELVPYAVTRPTPDGVPGIHWCRFGGKGRIIVRGGRPCVFEPKAGG